MNKDQLIKLNLQLFAEEPLTDDNNRPSVSDDEDSAPKEPEKKYSDADVDEIVKRKLAKAEREKNKAVEEAAKLAKMNADEKEKYEREKLEAELAEYKRKDAFYGLSKEASKMLSEHGIVADDETLELVVKDDAEATKQSVEAFVAIINKKVQEGVKEALAGKSPKANTNPEQFKNPFSREHFNLTEQGRLKKEDPERYKILKALAGK